MHKLTHLFDSNAAWATQVKSEDPGFFERLSKLQAPKYLWIGCADSRVPANQITGLLPGELFVHRNVANLVVHSDLNCLSVMQFAVDVLRVEHLMVVGHYGCGGVRAALESQGFGLIDNWLRHIQDISDKHGLKIKGVQATTEEVDRMCEYNALEAARNACRTTIVRDAWARGQALTVHAWVYGLRDGLLKDVGFNVAANEEVEPAYSRALDRIGQGLCETTASTAEE